MVFLMSCWVMVEPPCEVPETTLETNAPTMRLTSTPLCSKKRASSTATKAFCSVRGISVMETMMRSSVPL